MWRLPIQVLAVVTALVVLVVSVACVGGTCLLALSGAESFHDGARAKAHACCGATAPAGKTTPRLPRSDRCDRGLMGTDSVGHRTAAADLLALHWLHDLPVGDSAVALPPRTPLLDLPGTAPRGASSPPTLLALGCALNA